MVTAVQVAITAKYLINTYQVHKSLGRCVFDLSVCAPPRPSEGAAPPEKKTKTFAVHWQRHWLTRFITVA